LLGLDKNFFALGKEVDLGKLLMMTFAYCSTFWPESTQGCISEMVFLNF
jgi:hypothetical protein